MNLTSKLQALKEELKQREAEKDAAHNRIIVLKKLIKSTETLIRDAEEIFPEEKKLQGIEFPWAEKPENQEIKGLAKSDNGHLSV
jgi:hypothetical protein